MRRSDSSVSREPIETWVRENHELIVDVLRNGDDPFARACALVALKYGGSEHDLTAIKKELEELC